MENYEMKEMKYRGDGNSELLYYTKDEEGYGIAVINVRGSHPCGYITFPGIEKVNNYDAFTCYKENDAFGRIDIGPHYGYTFLGTLENNGLEGRWLGWDYAHLGDWVQSMPPEKDVFAHFGDKKHTTNEIALSALAQIFYIKSGWYEYDEG